MVASQEQLAMDEYEKKFAEMQMYIPFLEAMIERLQNVTDKSREVQLQKMQQLHGILSSNKRKLRIETLQRCEDVLQKLHSKVEKGTNAALNFPVKETEKHPAGPSNASTVTSDKISRQTIECKKVKSSKKMDETPASPSPPASPDIASKSISTGPIMIPTERAHDYNNDKVDSKPASPDESETVATKEPIIIPTERKNDWSERTSQNVTSHSSSKTNSYGSHKVTDSRSHQRHILSVANSTTGSRRFSSTEKNCAEVIRLDDDSDDVLIDSSKQNRLTSPDSHNTSTKNPTSLLASPPPELNAPPLSMEDLAELLNENTDGSSNKTSTSHGRKDNYSRSVREKILYESKKSENEKKLGKNSMADYMNDNTDNERRWEEVDKHIVKLTTRKSLPSAMAINVGVARSDAFTVDPKPKSLSPSNHSSKLNKSIDNKNLPVSTSMKNCDRTTESRYTDNYERYPRHTREPQSDNQNIPMPDMNVIKSAFSRLSEGDIANLVQTNLQIQTDNFLHADDRNPLFSRRPTSDQNQQRSDKSGHLGHPEPDYQRENPEFYDMHQQAPIHHQSGAVGYSPTVQWNQNSNMRGHMHGSELSPRQQYQHVNNVPHQDIWNMASNSMPLDNHHTPNQFAGGPSRGVRPLMGSQTDMIFTEDLPLSPPPPPPPALIPALMSSPTFSNAQYRGFPADNRSFERPSEFPHLQSRQQWDHPPNRSNESNFDRSIEYPHVPPRQPQWEQLPSRPKELHFDRPTELPQTEYPPRTAPWEHESNYHDSARARGMNENCYGRSPNVEPSTWSRSNDVGCEGPSRSNERVRGNERFPNERNRPGESTHSSNFTRSRPSEWDRPPQNESSNRYRDRDPRCRSDSTNHSSSTSSASIPRRDPRLSKECPSQSTPIMKTKETPMTTPATKPKDPPIINKRDPRRRSVDIKDSHKSRGLSKSSHRDRSRSIDKSRESSKNTSTKSKKDSVDHKSSNEKPSKDVETMQSPLESLYGVIDTAAKTGKGYGLQKFKIPKIRRSEPIVPRPPTPPKPSRHTVDEVEWTAEHVLPTSSSKSGSPDKIKNQHDEKKMEVTSTTEEIVDPPIFPIVSPTEAARDTKCSEAVTTNKEVSAQSNENKKCDDKLEDANVTVDMSFLTKNSETEIDTVPENQVKDCVTQELIESLIKKSLESGEGKKLFEQAKLLQRLGEALDPKKYKKIQKIINADSESSSSDKEEPTIKKVLTKKKRRAIVSDSSDEECLANRLGIINKTNTSKTTKNKKIALEDEKMEVEKKDASEDNVRTSEIEKPPSKKQKRTAKKKSKTTPEVNVKETEEPKEETPKPPARTAKKRRNSLEMLQEDIREMFISEGVVTATGHRMCRLMKEAENNLSSISGDGKSDATSIYITSSPERNNDMQSDEDDSSPKSRGRNKARTVKNFDVEESPKSRLRSRKGRKRAAKSSRGIIQSSDSELEQTSTLLDESAAAATANGTSDTAKSNNILNELASSITEVASDDLGPILRRSERVAMKEPRVHIEKIDSSKIMFDTSSDESFGIDVSELTAAVDISLHSERQSADDGNESITGSLKKLPDKAMKSRKKNSNDINERKLNTPVTFDDDISITSDISILSSTTSNTNKKITSSSPCPDNNKDLIGDILENVSDDKAMDTSNTNVGKESDLEADEEKDTSIMDDNKKPQSKSKKKRCRWQMGIVPKCKKKKCGSLTESTVVSPVVMSDKDNANTSIETNEESVSVVSEIDPVELNTNVKKNAGESNIESLNSTVIVIDNAPPKLNEENELDVSQSKIDKKVFEIYQSLSLNEVIEYAWTGQERYKCFLCQFNGKNIVHHYKISHPGEEIMISRLTLLDTKRAIDEAKDETFIKLSKKLNSGPRRKFSCRFCVYSNEGVKKSVMESFYEHCTTHTGEYRFICRNCGYQAISKSSMKPHYYKICRKSGESFINGIAEDPIPSEEFIPGYLCSVCHYIQLKESNVKTHIDNIHKNVSDVEIIKINMSGYFDVKDNEELNDTFDEAISFKTESDHGVIEQTANQSNIVICERDKSNSEIEILDRSTDEIQELPLKRHKSAIEVVQDESENPYSKKLNAFVCPPELENKAVEIELERKKKMQEILNNIGIKFQKPSSNNGLSIIDKLKDKMTTNISDSELTQMEVDEDEGTLISQDDKVVAPNDSLTCESITSVNNLDEIDDNESSKSTTFKQDCTVTLAAVCETLENTIQHNANADKIDKKMKDPLASVQNDKFKDGDSEHETSDNEPIASASRSYESDSSEISDTELPTDVNSLLEAAGTINTLTNAPMMTTIQRLAAQLQGVKNFSTMNNDLNNDEEQYLDEETVEAEMLENVTAPVTTVNSKIDESTDEPSTSVIMPVDDSQTDDGRKNFIRLRRLSGDKLSIQESASPPVSETSSPRAEEKSLGLLSTEVSQADFDEECSFLKIENVVSLAPNTACTSGVNSLKNDVRNSGTMAPGKTVGVSLLKKPLGVLKKLRSVGTLEGLIGRLPPIAPAQPKCITLSKIPLLPATKNLKIVKVRDLTTLKQKECGKVVREFTSLKQKDSGHSSCAPKLKTVEAYTSMLTAAKLRHLFKCMARSCVFSSDSIEAFGKHYQNHVDQVDRQGTSPPYDYEKCAYCSDSLSTWEEMRSHFKTKHTYCSFQCSYCFYRAFTQSYVELHQSTSHAGKPPSVILGMRDYHSAEMIDRREHVIPFVCKHECNKLFYVPEAFIAHLKTKHCSTLSIFNCHLCPASTLKSEQLIAHYKMHGIYKYQCLYCLFGSDAPMELHHHLSLMHFNRPPKILERSLPPQPVRDKDVLLQLIIRNLDDTFKCSELKIIADPSNIDSLPKFPVKRRKRGGPNPPLPGDVVLTGSGNPIKILPRPVKLVSHAEVIDLRDSGNKSSMSPHNVFINLADTLRVSGNINDNQKLTVVKIGEKLTVDNPLKSPITIRLNEKPKDNDQELTEKRPSPETLTEQVIHHEPELEVRYVNEQLKSKIDNAVDPLSLPVNLNCSDEFISINVLDNPEILKTPEHCTIQKNDQKTDKVVNDNDDDSDIEILEHIQHTDESLRNKSGPTALLASEVANSVLDKNNDREDKKELNLVEPEEKQAIVCSSNENSNISADLNAPGENIVVQDKPIAPLTLDDIKDTGFSGRDLYKCGYDGCTFATSLSAGLKNHIKQCAHANEKKEFNCIHCKKRFVKIGYLLEHLKIHGLKRFGCSLCHARFALSYQAMSHIKFKHKVNNNKMIPADPTNPSADGLYVIHPDKSGIQKYRGKKGGKSKSPDKKRGNEEKLSFSPTDIDVLPRQAIYNREVQCAVCPYKTKVRTNIIRHLQLHAKDETVPESGPVNPVPCLDKKERMFDKMVNLASSSHQNGRMGGTIKETVKASEADGLPIYVPEQKRYVCGVSDCNYLTVDETMLRYHSKALHPDEVNFRCPHCPSPSPGQESPQIIPIDKMGVHLKMHDTRLYKCSHCNHHHYHRHVVERHMTDKHTEHRPYVKIIREIDNTENLQQQSAQDEPEEGPADRDGNYWKCNLCDYKCVYKSEMVTHAGSTHNEKAQFKCSMCIFKTTARISVEQHIVSKHINDPDCTYTLAYERIKGPKPTSVTEPLPIDEPFDTTPLWRRDMPRIRHIRGILLEEENEVSRLSDTPIKSGKRKNDGEISTRPTKIRVVKSVSLDGSTIADNKGKNETKGEPIDNTSDTTTPAVVSSPSNQGTIITRFNTKGKEPASYDSCETVGASSENKFGTYVEPNGRFYVCSLCPNYKSKFRQDIRNHMYRDLKYWRWHCKTCGYLAVSQSLITKHVNRQHKDMKPDCVAIKSNPEIENWVRTFLDKQLAVMRGVTKHISTPICNPIVSKSSTPQIDMTAKSPKIMLEDIVELPTAKALNNAMNESLVLSLSSNTVVESPSVMSLSTMSSTDTTKTVDLTEAISSLQAISNSHMGIDSNDNDDDNDDDGDALVIDSKDDLLSENSKDIVSGVVIAVGKNQSTKQQEAEEIYVCKHCDMKFSRWRGFKLHVQVSHLKRLGFLCPYCDRSTNSETMMRQHLRTKHPGRAENIVQNPAAGGPELSDAFWEQEYGLIRPKRVKKRKLKRPHPDPTDGSEEPEKTATPEVCTICGFSAMNVTGLKAHMRSHANKHTLKCVHCSFTTNSQTEMWQHSEMNHPNMEWCAQEINAAGSSEGQPVHQYTKSLGEEDYSKDIEEESVPESFEPKFILSCFYCNLRSASLDSVKKHWNLVHKDYRESSEHKTGVPFQYKEIPVKTISQHKLMKCAYCPKKGAIAALRTHARKKHPNLQAKFTEAIDTSRDIWICKWCNESCEANSKTVHHNMFHSHLPVRFRKEHDMQIMQKGLVCPECGFVCVSLSRMKTHVGKHYDTFRCKRCDGNFASIILATQHSTREHPGLSANIEGTATNIDLIMARVSETDCAGIVSNVDNKVKAPPSNDIFRNLGVAKKSTTKQIIRTPTTSPSKSVARKSTNPLPRYPPGTVFDIDNILDDCGGSGNSARYSYYGLPKEPVDLANLNTTMAVGGAQMKVKCNTLAQIIDIDPCIYLVDIRKAKN